MNIKIVTDSTSDLPVQLAKEHDIRIVPAYVHFGDQLYRDRVDISEDELYNGLIESGVSPTTEPASPEDFASVYQELAHDADAIISIHISSKISAMYNAAVQAKIQANLECPIEVVDSQSVSMGLGLLSIAAAETVRSGASFAEVLGKVQMAIPCIGMLGLFDSLKYLSRGGRINQAVAFFGTMLNVKPMLTIKNGEVEPAGQAYKRTTGIEHLFNFVKKNERIQDVAVIYSTVQQEAQELARRITSFVPADRMYLAKLGPTLGVHGGPGVLLVAVRRSTQES
jgi:DegV family protein with EDD domain